MTAEELEERIGELGRLLADAHPGVRPLTLRVSAVASAADFDLRGPDGSRLQSDGETILDVSDVVDELREGMYQEGRGTWWTARAVVTAEDRAEVGFDYDTRPEPEDAFPASAFAADLEAFPRDAEHRPDWLAELLKEAGGG